MALFNIQVPVTLTHDSMSSPRDALTGVGMSVCWMERRMDNRILTLVIPHSVNGELTTRPFPWILQLFGSGAIWIFSCLAATV